MSLVSHNNSNQRVDTPGFSPLLRNESPYYNNINRPSKNAYDYADEINRILSLGGYVTKYAPASDEGYSLYEFVQITDDEKIESAPTNLSPRVGLIVTEATEEGEYWVCTFCPNFIFPSGASVSNFGTSPNQSKLCLVNTSGTPATTVTLDALQFADVGSEAIAKKIGPKAIFFSGTARIF